MALTEGRLLSFDLLLFLFTDDQDAHSCGRNLQRMLATFQHLLCKKTLDQGSICKVIHPKYYKQLKKRCSPKPEILNKIRVQILTLNFQVNLEYFFIQKTCKMKICNNP
jgi:hypothetical protein